MLNKYQVAAQKEDLEMDNIDMIKTPEPKLAKSSTDLQGLMQVQESYK